MIQPQHTSRLPAGAHLRARRANGSRAFPYVRARDVNVKRRRRARLRLFACGVCMSRNLVFIILLFYYVQYCNVEKKRTKRNYSM